MVDDHTREKISHNGKRISPETKGVIVDDHTLEKNGHLIPTLKKAIGECQMPIIQ